MFTILVGTLSVNRSLIVHMCSYAHCVHSSAKDKLLLRETTKANLILALILPIFALPSQVRNGAF